MAISSSSAAASSGRPPLVYWAMDSTLPDHSFNHNLRLVVIKLGLVVNFTLPDGSHEHAQGLQALLFARPHGLFDIVGNFCFQRHVMTRLPASCVEWRACFAWFRFNTGDGG